MRRRWFLSVTVDATRGNGDGGAQCIVEPVEQTDEVLRWTETENAACRCR